MNSNHETFTGSELFNYWRDNITFKYKTVVAWDDLLLETQERWNSFAAMINLRMTKQ